MAITSFDKSDLVRITTTFTNSAGAVTDPTDVSAIVKSPAGTETSYAYDPGDIVKDSTGVYHLDITPTVSGTWVYKFTGTGDVAQIDEGEFYVLVSDIQGSSALGGWNELRERVFTKARDSAREFIHESDVDLWMTEAIEDLSSRLQLGHAESTGTTSGNTIAIPDDYVDLISLEVTLEGTSNDFVLFVDDNVFNGYQEEVATLDRTLGRVFNGNFELYPTPDTGTAYAIRYWSTSSSVQGLTPPLRTRVVNYAIARVKEKEDDFRAAEYYMKLYERGLPAPRNLSVNAPILGDITFQPGPFDTWDSRL